MIGVIDSVMGGQGLYTVAEAALYARMSSQTASAWFFPSKRGTALRQASIKDDDNRYLTFAEFSEAVAIRFLRHHYKVTLQCVREAIKYVNEAHPGIAFPLTQKHSKISVYQKQLYIFLDGDDSSLVKISGKGIGQKHFHECFLGYLDDFNFTSTGTIESYIAYHHQQHPITMQPNRNMGSPMVGNTGFSAATLHGAVIQEGSIERAAKAYEVPIAAVKVAFSYWDELAAA